MEKCGSNIKKCVCVGGGGGAQIIQKGMIIFEAISSMGVVCVCLCVRQRERIVRSISYNEIKETQHNDYYPLFYITYTGYPLKKSP